MSNVRQTDGKRLDSGERVLKVERVGVGVDPAKLHDLDAVVLDLKVLGRLLGHPAAKVQLVDLAVLVPDGGLVEEDVLATRVARPGLAGRPRVEGGEGVAKVSQLAQIHRSRGDGAVPAAQLLRQPLGSGDLV